MTTSVPITLQQGDEKIRLTIRTEDGPLHLVEGITVIMYVKRGPLAKDSDPKTLKLTDVEITDAVNGVCVVSVPMSLTTKPGTYWYRVDVLGAGGTPVKPAAKGQVFVR